MTRALEAMLKSLAPMLDRGTVYLVQWRGRYVVVAPSVHVSGLAAMRVVLTATVAEAISTGRLHLGDLIELPPFEHRLFRGIGTLGSVVTVRNPD